MFSVEVEVVHLLVGRKVIVIEEETIETDTVSKLEVIIYRPVILSVNTCSVESYTGSRVLLTIITISHADYLRSCSVQEVIEASVTVVTCTVSHVCVVSHLILIAQTTDNLVVAEIVGKVILKIEHVVVHTIVPCEELITE